MQRVGLIFHLLNTLLDATRRFDCSLIGTLCLMQCVGLIFHLLNTLLDAMRRFDFFTY